MLVNMLKTRYSKLSLLATFLLALGSSASYAADTSKGGGFYKSYCAACHGVSGTSVMPSAPNFAQGERLMQPDTQLLTFIRDGKNAMPAYKGILSDSNIMDVIAYLRTLH